MPALLNVPIGFSNQAFMIVTQEEIEYQDGNLQEDLRFEDCFSWEELSHLAANCPFKCLPVISQSYYEEKSDRPRCHTGFDHNCMSYALWQVHLPNISLKKLIHIFTIFLINYYK